MDTPSILIQGIGGIGGVIAGRLIQAGQQPMLVTGNDAIRDAIRRDGLEVRGVDDTFKVQASVVSRLEDLPPEQRWDVSLLVMKANPVVEVARETLPHLEPEHGYLVTCQNGIVEDAVAQEVGRPRVVSAIVGWGGTLHAPGVVERTGPGAIHLGELDGSRSDRVAALARALAPASQIEITDNILGALWAKLAINCTITTVGALAGQTLGELLGNRLARQVFLRVYGEVIETSRAAGVQLERIAVDPLLLYLPHDAGWLRRQLKDGLARLVGRRYRRLRSSMLQSLERGRPTEIDYLNGYVAARAARLGVAAPVNAAVTRMIHEIERGERMPGTASVVELAATVPGLQR